MKLEDSKKYEKGIWNLLLSLIDNYLNLPEDLIEYNKEYAFKSDINIEKIYYCKSYNKF